MKTRKFDCILKVITLAVAIFIGIKQIGIMSQQTEILKHQNKINEQQKALFESSSTLLYMPVLDITFEKETSELILKNTGTSPFFIVERDLPWKPFKAFKPMPVPPGKERRFEANLEIGSWRKNSENGHEYIGKFIIISPVNKRYIVESKIKSIRNKEKADLEITLLYVVSESEIEKDRNRRCSEQVDR